MSSLKNCKVGDKLYTLYNGEMIIIEKCYNHFKVKDHCWNTYNVNFQGVAFELVVFEEVEAKPWKPPFCFINEEACKKYFTEIERVDVAPPKKVSFEDKLKSELKALRLKTSYEMISIKTKYPKSSVYKMMKAGMILRVGFVVALENAGLIDLKITESKE